MVHKPTSPVQGRFPVGSSAFLAGPAGPPASAGSNARAFRQWSDQQEPHHHVRQPDTSATSLQTAAVRASRLRQAKTATSLAGEAKVIKLTAELAAAAEPAEGAATGSSWNT